MEPGPPEAACTASGPEALPHLTGNSDAFSDSALKDDTVRPPCCLESDGNSPTSADSGVFQVAEKMEKRRCALCPKDLECSVLYFAQSQNIAAHENCLLYSSALVECENPDPCNCDRSFDVEAVKKEISRGRRLKCTFCEERGATVGCDERACPKNYHFFCAMNDSAVLHTESGGIYKVFCKEHASLRETQNGLLSVKPLSGVFHPHHNQKTTPRPGVKRKRRKRKGLSSIPVLLPEPMTLRSTEPMKEDGRHTDTTVKVAFLKKCKEAGLLHHLFEEILDKLHLAQERLMDESTSDSDYEEIGTSLFENRLFEDAFVSFQAALESKIHQCDEKRHQMKKEIKLLQDLKQTLCFVQGNRHLKPDSASITSLSS